MEDCMRVEAARTVFADELLSPGVHNQVFVQVGLLGETLHAAGLLADEGPLLCVDAKMVEEVVPLAEEHCAPFVVTLEDFNVSLGAWVLVPKHSESSGGRYFFFNFDGAEIKVAAILHMDTSAVWNLAADFIFADLLAVHHEGVFAVEVTVFAILVADIPPVVQGILAKALRHFKVWL